MYDINAQETWMVRSKKFINFRLVIYGVMPYYKRILIF